MTMLLHPHSYAALAGVVLLLAATAAPPLSTLLLAMPQAPVVPPVPNLGVVGGQGGANFLKFDPAAVTIKDTEVTEVSISLLSDPGEVKPAVFVEADGVRFEECRYDLGKGNPSQKIKMYPKASFTEGTSNSVLAAKLAWQGNAMHGQTQSLTVARQVAAGRICQANGDPHYISFDDKHFDFWGMKCYYLLKSPALVVQARHGPWEGNPAAAIHVGAAVAYGKTAWMVDCTQADAAKRVVMMSPDTAGIDVVKTADTSDIQFQMGDGSQVKMQIAGGGTPGCYINIQVVVPACYKGKTQGLCGIYDDNQNNDWTKADGTTGVDQNDFGNSWEIKPDEDMFAKGYTSSIFATLQAQPITKECKLPTDLSGFGVAPPPVNYNPVAVAQVAQPVLPPVVIPPPVPSKRRTDQAFMDFITALCKKALTIPGFDQIPSVKSIDDYVKDCITDCSWGATLDPIDKFRTSYQRYVYTQVSASMDKFKICEKTGKPRTRTDKELTDEASRLGFGNFKCPGNAAAPVVGEYGAAPAAAPAAASCSNNGQCRTFGCKCDKGWTMYDCSLDLSKQVIPPAPAAAAEAPAGVAAAPPPPPPAPVVAPAPPPPAPVPAPTPPPPPPADDYAPEPEYRRR